MVRRTTLVTQPSQIINARAVQVVPCILKARLHPRTIRGLFPASEKTVRWPGGEPHFPNQSIIGVQSGVGNNRIISKEIRHCYQI
jgi:hypothetical protein